MTTDVYVESVPALDIRLDTSEWFEWVSSQSQFKYIGNSTEMSVKRRASNGKWYARKKVYSSDKGSVPVDLYIGSDEECTSEKLKEINYRFGQNWRDFWPWYHSPARKESKAKGVQVYTEPPQSSQTQDEIRELEQLNEETRRLNAELKLEREQKENYRSKWERAQKQNSDFFLELKAQRTALDELEKRLEQSLDNAKHWEEVAGSYRRQADGEPRLNQSNPAALLNRLRKERKSSKADLKDIELLVELIQMIII